MSHPLEGGESGESLGASPPPFGLWRPFWKASLRLLPAMVRIAVRPLQGLMPRAPLSPWEPLQPHPGLSAFGGQAVAQHRSEAVI